jgi:acetyltransferase-like isoleucine patch superfamily enzyme
MRYGKFRSLYVKFCEPSSEEYTEFLRLHGNLYSIGENCTLLPSTVFTDPSYVRIGNNVHFSSCIPIDHDGAIAMLNQAYNVKLDAVGKIDIRDNVLSATTRSSSATSPSAPMRSSPPVRSSSKMSQKGI